MIGTLLNILVRLKLIICNQNWLLVVGYSLLVIRYSLFVVGYWLYVIDHPLLEIEASSLIQTPNS